LEALARARGFLRARVGEALTTRFTPDLHFELDRSFDEAQHIAQILHSPEVARDLQPKDDVDNAPHSPSSRTERSADPGSRGAGGDPGSAKQHSVPHRARDDDDKKDEDDGTP
jgi:hypothetical protein